MSEPITDAECRYLRAVLATEAGDVQHEIRVERVGVDRFRGVCSCGKYRTRKTYFYPGLAEAAAWDHAKAHGANPADTNH